MPDFLTIYRITHQRYSGEPFSGKGGLHYRSRWASKGQLVSYASGHLATATLEKIAGVGRPDLLTEMARVKAEVPGDLVDVLPSDDLPEDWDALPPTDRTRQVGDQWLESEENLLLRVPAVVLPDCYNYVINAAHSDADALRVVETAPLLLDNRVLRQLGTAGLDE
ncbi:RES family NAD+ phosphorylase [Salinibacter altiplanensis]|uniref:RES family NAD+ phosphorylase n=1 Tax=Salinibacter altiplanensis TaxID=1803181 RepID=UPI000C9FC444|nr:RES family NAD+ phosphorylase [Salinibacter altiplanensis]